MFLVHVQFKSKPLNGIMIYQDTMSEALYKAEEIVKENGNAKSIEIFEDKKHIISLRTIR